MNKPYWPRMLQVRAAHLHAQGAYVEQLLSMRTLRNVPAAYGVALLEIVSGAEGEVVVKRLEAVFASGAVASVRADAPLRRPVATRGDASVDVYLGLPHAILRGPNVCRKGGPARSTRFVAPAPED
ncbi:MAG: type VI secretion system baseplate subunit TssK, partial [Polyangiaceae bacterium]